MSGASARIFTLISTQIPHLHLHHHARRLFLSPPAATSLSRHHLSLLSSHQPNVLTTPPPPPPPPTQNLWPEWSHLVHRLSIPDHRPTSHIDEFVEPCQLSRGFLEDASRFLAFARQHPSLLWSLPREDIEVLVESVSPSLFKDAAVATTRMKCFVAGEYNHVLESDKPSTIDLMKYLLSYVYMAIVSSEEVHVSSRAEPSVRKLFSELVKSKGTPPEPSELVQFQGRYAGGPQSVGKVIKMKRGDYICRRCSFLNFAKNKKCLQCEEPRPKRFLTGGEWECPQCDFFNFSRNVVCLRCDCKKPGVKSLRSTTIVSGLGGQVASSRNESEKHLAGSNILQQKWFTKVVQLETSSDPSSSLADEDLLKSIKAGNNRFATPARNSDLGNVHVDISQSLDELLADKSGASSRDGSPFPTSSSDLQQNGFLNPDSFALANEQSHKERATSRTGHKEREQPKKSEIVFEKLAEPHVSEDLPGSPSDVEFPKIMPMREGENLFVVSKRKDRSLTSPMYKRRMAMEQAHNSNHVPFVPFPPGYFAQGKQQEGPNSTEASSKMEASRDGKNAMPDYTGAVRINNQPTDVRISGARAFDSQISCSPDGYPGPQSTSANDVHGASSQSTENPPWRGRSLEGSAVKESDPLDMSEEAKAERWFRRVAQIKDISELSQIPDEDFPSIMPMRKGVNRFVVSKRKTPLERRLTSSQYRKNLPVADGQSDAVRKQT